jgi:hypothetical protein
MAWDPEEFRQIPTHFLHDFTAIWDTGATNTVVTQAVIDACGLKPTGIAEVHGVTGIERHPTFVVHVGLPNHYMFPDLQVTRGALPGGDEGDILIGMDIIGRGDFAVTCHNGQTVFSYRLPSRSIIDFVAEDEERRLDPRSRPRNAKRPPKKFGKNKR